MRLWESPASNFQANATIKAFSGKITGGYPCTPLECDDPSLLSRPIGNISKFLFLFHDWRNRIANEVSTAHPGVYTPPLGSLTAASMSDAHISTFLGTRWMKECTHFSYSPGLTEAVAYLVLTAVLAADNGIPPRSVVWRPKT